MTRLEEMEKLGEILMDLYPGQILSMGTLEQNTWKVQIFGWGAESAYSQDLLFQRLIALAERETLERKKQNEQNANQ